ncbi:hypothetical protein [Actinosynnema sp. NPDC020468]|uniref:hypothetical protein n=1 Tax=Actinosynnema sp. NPDC020468 TaxID=3154488 RepID=UPI0033DF5487
MAGINPFTVAGFDSPMQPLCPFRHEHDDLYVGVDDSERQYERFRRHLGDLSSLRSDGRIALVTGDTGCGKSALVNRCAAWVVRKLTALGVTANVVDATTALAAARPSSPAERLAAVTDHLFDALRHLDVLEPTTLAEFELNRTNPMRVYRNLYRYLRPDHALVVLLPSPGVRWDEVVTYADLRQGNVLFVAESDALGEKDVARIANAVERHTRLVDLRVGALKPGDVRAFVADRFGRHRAGRFPALADAVPEWADSLALTVGQLQRILHSTYEHLLDQDTDYGDRPVTKEDILADIRRRNRLLDAP